MQRSTARIRQGNDSAVDKFLPSFPNGKSLPGDIATEAMHEDELLELGMLVSVSLEKFASLPADRIEREIADLLRQVRYSCRFDHCALVKLTRDKATRAIHVSQMEGTTVAPDIYEFIHTFPWTGENLLGGNIVCFAGANELPPGAEVDRRHYEAMGVRAYMAIPIYYGGSVEFFISVHKVSTGHVWSKETISQLRLIGEVLVNALGHRRDDREVDVRLQVERLISDLSARFINVTAGEVDREIVAALERVREMFCFDRFGLITFSADKSEMIVTHSSCGEGISPFPEKADIGLLFPWAKKLLLRGEIVYCTSPDDLPAEASVDRKSWQRLGVRAKCAVPIHVGGSVEYLVIASHVRSTRSMDPELFPRLRILGEIFANALVRCKREAAQREFWEDMYRRNERLQSEAECLQSEVIRAQNHEEIIGQSNALLSTLKLTEQVAPTDSTVLISGETGTGKELAARAIHQLSLRRNKPMVKVNCASLPAALVESELFGREKGAYTGALTRQAGRFEIADGGTIFLDEIAEMSLELQAKLLRVLQEGQFERLGSTKTIQVDVRVIAATNRNLAEEVKKGNFREDLYYRLNVFQIVVPPLRERLEDIPLMVWAFVDEFGQKMGKKINKVSKQDMTALQRYPWPGNIRELRNVIEHAVIVSSGDRLQIRLPENNREQMPGMLTLEECEVRHIREALQLTGWRIKGEGGAARLLGLNPSTLYSRMQKLGISNHRVKDEMSP